MFNQEALLLSLDLVDLCMLKPEDHLLHQGLVEGLFMHLLEDQLLPLELE